MTHAPVQESPAPVYVKAPSNGLATASLVLGIIGTVIAFIPLLGVVGAVVGGVGLALGIAAFFVARKRGVGMGKTIAGLILGVVSLVVFFAITAATVAAVDGAVDEVNKSTDTSATTDVSDSGELKDAQLGKLSKDAVGDISVKVTLTNHSDGISDYMGTVVFESPNGKTQYGTGALFVENLKPGQTKTEEVMMLDTLPKSAHLVTTRLTDFDRMSSL